MRLIRLFLPNRDHQNFTIDQELINEAALRYGFQPSELQPVRKMSSLMFRIPGKSYLKLTPEAINPYERISQINHWQNYLGKNSSSIVAVLPSLRGENAEKIFHKKGYYTSVMYENSPGSTISSEEWDTGIFHRVGRLTGLLHRLTKNYQAGANADQIPLWHIHTREDFMKYLFPRSKQMFERYEKLFETISSSSKSSDNFGIIHSDIHKGNILNSGPDLVLVDFDETCHSWFVNDIANVFYSTLLLWKKTWTESQEQFSIYKSAFWDGYFRENELSESELKSLPSWMALRSMYNYAFQLRLGAATNFNPTLRAYYLMTKNYANTEFEQLDASLFY